MIAKSILLNPFSLFVILGSALAAVLFQSCAVPKKEDPSISARWYSAYLTATREQRARGEMYPAIEILVFNHRDTPWCLDVGKKGAHDNGPFIFKNDSIQGTFGALDSTQIITILPHDSVLIKLTTFIPLNALEEKGWIEALDTTGSLVYHPPGRTIRDDIYPHSFQVENAPLYHDFGGSFPEDFESGASYD